MREDEEGVSERIYSKRGGYEEKVGRGEGEGDKGIGIKEWKKKKKELPKRVRKWRKREGKRKGVKGGTKKLYLDGL